MCSKWECDCLNDVSHQVCSALLSLLHVHPATLYDCGFALFTTRKPGRRPPFGLRSFTPNAILTTGECCIHLKSGVFLAPVPCKHLLCGNLLEPLLKNLGNT